MKRFLFSAACAASLLAGAALADDTFPGIKFTGTAAITSDYEFRGQTQNAHNAAFQAGITGTLDSGFYAGAWMSNIDFGDGTVNDDRSHYELDVFAGYGGAIDDTLTFDVKAYGYLYPDAPDGKDYDYFEGIGTLTKTIDKFSVYGSVALSPNFFGDTGFAVWVGGGAAYQIDDTFKVSGNLGYQWIDDNEKAGIDDYFHYDIGVSATIDILTLDVRYYGTNVSTDECYGGTNICSERVVGTATLAF